VDVNFLTMIVKIKKITAKQTYELRHPLLRKGQPINTCHLPLDNDSKSIHLGAYFETQLVGVLSAFNKSCPGYESKNGIQLRAIAVHTPFQGKGIATQLIQKAFLSIRKTLTIHHVWLNARIVAKDLYLKNNFKPIGNVFEIDSIGLHQRFIKNAK
jgi:GNAT superfamily N-acetyltransferase